jgi:DNA-binding response OmpR family regulator
MKILLIDDDEEVRETLSSILKLYDYAMTTCEGGKEGLEVLSNQNFDCILLDLTMPNFSGFDFLEELGHEKISSNIIFTFSAMNLSNQQQDYLTKMGIKKMILKPIGTNELIEILEKVGIK